MPSATGGMAGVLGMSLEQYQTYLQGIQSQQSQQSSMMQILSTTQGTHTIPQLTPVAPQPGAMTIDADGNPIPKRKRRTYSEDNNAPIATIFGLADPRIITNAAVEAYLTHHPHLAVREPYIMAAPKVYVGIEVEVENVLKVDPNINLLYWQTKADGSLRNHGVEFVTPGVIPAGLAEPGLKQLFDGLNPDVDFSPRTSIHVHMDVRQLTLKQIVGLLLTYTAVENLLFKYVGLTRRSNIFCVPLIETGLYDNLSVDPKRFMYSIDQYWSKYTSLNLLPMLNFGSVEFRHLPGTRNLRQVLVWIDLITRLKLYVYKHSLDAIVSQIAELNGNSRYKQFVEGIFGDATTYLDTSNLLADMERPVYVVKNSMISNTFDMKVRKSPLATSQLGVALFAWAKALTPEQYATLVDLCTQWKNPNYEQVFRDMISRTAAYLKTYPNDHDKIFAVIKSHRVETKEKKAKMFPGFDPAMATITTSTGDPF